MAEGRDTDLPLKNAQSVAVAVVVIYRVCPSSLPPSLPPHVPTLGLAVPCLPIKERGRACVKLRQVMAKSLGAAAAGRSDTVGNGR